MHRLSPDVPKKNDKTLGDSLKNTYLCSVKRRNQVEPRCAERWHLRDDEQFDLLASLW